MEISLPNPTNGVDSSDRNVGDISEHNGGDVSEHNGVDVSDQNVAVTEAAVPSSIFSEDKFLVSGHIESDRPLSFFYSFCRTIS